MFYEPYVTILFIKENLIIYEMSSIFFILSLFIKYAAKYCKKNFYLKI